MLSRQVVNLVPRPAWLPFAVYNAVLNIMFAFAAVVLAAVPARYAFALWRYRQSKKPVRQYPGQPGAREPTQATVREIRARPPLGPAPSVVFPIIGIVVALAGIVVSLLLNYPDILGRYSAAASRLLWSPLRYATDALPLLSCLVGLVAIIGYLEIRPRRRNHRTQVEQRAWAQAWWDKWVAETQANLKIWQTYYPTHMDFIRQTKTWEDRRKAAENEAATAADTIKREVPRLVAALQKSFTAVRYQAALENPPITAEVDLIRLFAAAFLDLPIARDPMLITMLPHMMDEPLAALVAGHFPPGRGLATTFDEAAFLAENPKPIPANAKPAATFYSDWQPLEYWQFVNGKPCPDGYQ